MGAVGVGEEIILFQRPATAAALRAGSRPTGHATHPQAPQSPQVPGEVGLVQLPEITGRSGVENIDAAPVGLLLRGGVSV